MEHLAKAYGRRIETWALFYRRENNLPTRGSETNNYVEKYTSQLMIVNDPETIINIIPINERLSKVSLKMRKTSHESCPSTRST